MQKLEPISIRAIGVYGLVRVAEVDNYLIPDAAVTEVLNMHFDQKGAASVRLGMAAIGATVSAGYPCLGIHNSMNSTLIVVFSDGTNNDIYRYNGSAWAKSHEDDTAGSKTRFCDFLGRTIRVNGVDASIYFSPLSTAVWSSSGDPINPEGLWSYNSSAGLKPKFIEAFTLKLYLTGDATYPNRLYYSGVVNSSGNIDTWNESTNYVDISPSDGEDITGLKRYSLELDIFKPNYIYRFRSSGIDPDPLVRVGTRSNESIIEGKLGLYFHHDTGFYQYQGNYPKEISRPISDIVNAISYTNYSSICSWKDNDHIYWSVGDITIDNVTWKNVVCRYTESSELWTIYQTAFPINMATQFNNGSTIIRAVGTGTGVVATWGSGYTDLGEKIKFKLRTKFYEWAGIENLKTISELFGICEKAQGATLKYQTDENKEWQTIGDITQLITQFKNKNIKLHRIRFEVSGIISEQTMVFLGLRITEIINEGIL